MPLTVSEQISDAQMLDREISAELEFWARQILSNASFILCVDRTCFMNQQPLTSTPEECADGASRKALN